MTDECADEAGSDHAGRVRLRITISRDSQRMLRVLAVEHAARVGGPPSVSSVVEGLLLRRWSDAGAPPPPLLPDPPRSMVLRGGAR